MRKETIRGRFGKALAMVAVALPLMLAPAVSKAELATVVLNKIAAAMAIPAGDFPFFKSIIDNDMDAAPEIAAVAVMIRPDLAETIAFNAVQANPEKALQIARAMASACPSCSASIVAGVRRTNGGHNQRVDYEVAVGADTEIQNPSEGFDPAVDEEIVGTDVLSGSQPASGSSDNPLAPITDPIAGAGGSDNPFSPLTTALF